MPTIPIAEALFLLRRVWRYLEHAAETSPTDHGAAMASAHLLAVGHVMDTLEALEAERARAAALAVLEALDDRRERTH